LGTYRGGKARKEEEEREINQIEEINLTARYQFKQGVKERGVGGKLRQETRRPRRNFRKTYTQRMEEK